MSEGRSGLTGSIEGKSSNFLEQQSIGSAAPGEARFQKDYQFVQKLLANDGSSWDWFYKELHRKITAYLNNHYPNIVYLDINSFDDIFRTVYEKKILSPDRQNHSTYRNLRKYEGKAPFSYWVKKQIEWAVKDWFRKHEAEIFRDDTEREVLNDIQEDNVEQISVNVDALGDDPDTVPDAVNKLPDEQRWVFLLRYYYDFGFPEKEIELLSRKRRVSPEIVRQAIEVNLDPKGNDALKEKRELHHAFMLKYQKLRFDIWRLEYRVQLMEKAIRELVSAGPSRRLQDLMLRLEGIEEKIKAKKERLQALMKKRPKAAVETPYSIISKIIGEMNESTLRGRALLAEKKLVEMMGSQRSDKQLGTVSKE